MDGTVSEGMQPHFLLGQSQPPLQTPTREQHQVLLESCLTGSRWGLSLSVGGVRLSVKSAMPTWGSQNSRQWQCNAAPAHCKHCKQALEAAGVLASPNTHAREQVNKVEEEDCVGQPVAKKQHSTSFSVISAQLKQFHFLMAIHIINNEVFIKPVCKLFSMGTYLRQLARPHLSRDIRKCC